MSGSRQDLRVGRQGPTRPCKYWGWGWGWGVRSVVQGMSPLARVGDQYSSPRLTVGSSLDTGPRPPPEVDKVPWFLRTKRLFWSSRSVEERRGLSARRLGLTTSVIK